MQVTQIAAYASIAITDTKMQRFFYKSKLKSNVKCFIWQERQCLYESYSHCRSLRDAGCYFNRKSCPNLSRPLRSPDA